MIKFEQRFEDYAYRIADEYLDDSVSELEEGQWVAYNATGKLAIADGTVKAFLAIGSKRAGRDQVGGVSVKKISFLHGAFRLRVSNFDPAGTYATTMTPLVVTAGGILKPFDEATNKAHQIVAYAKGQPVDGFLTIYSA